MSPVRPNVLAARERLAHEYARLRERHASGGSGVEICAAISTSRDHVLLDLWESALRDMHLADPEGFSRRIALVAHGGYGRRAVSPYSDVDLLILHQPSVRKAVEPLVKQVLCDVVDAGLTLGHSVCTPRQAGVLACRDPLICTSLGESRLLAGSEDLFFEFTAGLARKVSRHRASLIAAIDRARHEERLRYGETVFLLEPNIKRSRGTLRDIQLLRWAGFVRYGQSDPAALCAQGVLSAEDLDVIERANEFLLRLRNEMHFHAGKPGDVLDRAEQLRIATARGYQADDGLLAVEQFMREYFRHTGEVSHVASQFMAKARAKEGWSRVAATLFGHRIEDGLRVGPTGIVASPAGLERLRGNFSAIMRMVDLANLYDKPIAPSTWEVVRRETLRLPELPDAEARRYFLSLLEHPARLGPILRDLHETRLLERFVPAFRHARGLLQFNQYHKYTVDVHCIRAVEAATEFALDKGPLGRAYRQIARKSILHLALLIHDLGKGLPEDHVPVGGRIAAEVAERLDLAPPDAETLKFLVLNHQMMEQLAFRRDTSDAQLVVRFAVDVGSPELLAMLFLITAADCTAVGPGVWDPWKEEIVSELYFRALEHLAGDTSAATFDEHRERRRDAVCAWLGAQKNEAWFFRQLTMLPAAYLGSTQPKQIADDLRLLYGLGSRGVVARGQYLADRGVLQFTVGTTEDAAPGIFHRLTGALTSKGLEILSAQINTLADGLVIDRFWVTDPDYSGRSPPDRIEEVRAALVESLHESRAAPPTFRRTWRVGRRHDAALASSAQTRVKIDNASSDRYTVLDIFAMDRAGLLYAITRTLYEMGLSVGRAKIATQLDQVLDVFYVTDREGNKIVDAGRLDEIRSRMLEAIAALEKEPVV